MILCNAKSDDAAAIVGIWNPVIRDTTVTFTTQLKTTLEIVQDIEARSLSGQAFIVAEDSGVVLGFARYAPFRSGPGYVRAMEHTVFVRADARGKGVGHQLMRHLETHAQVAGVHALIGGVSGENQQAISFHLALGYKRTGTLPEVGFKFGRTIDLIFLQKLVERSPDNPKKTR